jgi:tight adherence protein B
MGVLDRLAGTLRDDDEARQEVVSSLAASRATARLLAVLPVFGLLLGGGLGGRPWMVLIDSMIGAGCLLGGAVLAVAGVFWVERIADHAEAT